MLPVHLETSELHRELQTSPCGKALEGAAIAQKADFSGQEVRRVDSEPPSRSVEFQGEESLPTTPGHPTLPSAGMNASLLREGLTGSVYCPRASLCTGKSRQAMRWAKHEAV